MGRRKPTQSDDEVIPSSESTLPLRRSARQQLRKRSLELRSSAHQLEVSDSIDIRPAEADKRLDTASLRPDSIQRLPTKLPAKLPGLTEEGRTLLEQKQQRLENIKVRKNHLIGFCSGKSLLWAKLENAIDSTLVFAQEEAGTAVCISPTGLLLTCSHCVAETEEELDKDKIWWLIFNRALIVRAKTVKWDPKRDLALLQITASQYPLDYETETTAPFEFPYVSLTQNPPPVHTTLLCFGHPGSEDLEIGRPGVATGYEVLHLSDGVFKGYAEGQDVQDNSEIGALMHDCWTYWGHSGAPLIERGSGRLIGVHSSWDEETAMRRGVGWEALRDFLKPEIG